MAEAQQEQIEIELETPPPPQEVKVGDEAPSSPEQEGVEDLRQQLETIKAQEENWRRLQQESEERERERVAEIKRLQQEGTRSREELYDSQIVSVAQAITAEEAAAEKAQSDYERAFESGDAKAMAVAARAQARAETRLDRLQQSKADLEAERKTPAPIERDVPRQARQERKTDADPFEEMLTRVSPRTAKWMREHKEVVNDPKKWALAQGAHYRAVGQDYVPDSDAYFDFIDTELGFKQPVEKTVADPGAESTPARTRKAMPAAPVSRHGSNGSSSSGSGSRVTLTRGEEIAATDGTIVWPSDDPNGKFKKGDPIGVHEYARRKLEMTKQGFYRNNED